MRCSALFLAVLALSAHSGESAGGPGLLVRTLHAMTRLLNYFLVNIEDINLDAVFCARRAQEQLEAFLSHQPEVFLPVRRWVQVLRDKTKRVADEGTPYVYAQNRKYAGKVGMMLNTSTKLVWYPSADTSEEYVVLAIDCRHFRYDFWTENTCYNQLSGGSGKKCGVDSVCNSFNRQPHQRDYGITHQVLYWQAMEGFECVGKFSLASRQRFCSNVMRDAKKIFDSGMPISHADLFMEQVGLCGQWGFRDFNKEEWLEVILDWQSPTGCYDKISKYKCFDELPKETLIRVKRRERFMKDGCLSHKTAVGLLALTVNMRFEAEKMHSQLNGSSDNNRMNALLDGLDEK